MTSFLADKNIILGVTGSIAAYKSAELTRRLREVGATVRVVMTENAKRFITPLTMQAVSGHPVHDDLFDLQAEAAMGHIELARFADVVLVAPASADLMARLANGHASDLLTTICLATKAPIALAPAMNQGMWRNVLTEANYQALKQQSIHLLDPGEGSQACGDVGPGRMMEPTEIVRQLGKLFATGKLAGLRVLVSAGPTHEAIDPVRFVSNGSSGKMGYAIAEAAREAGANVTLVSGPVAIKKPSHIKCIDVVSAEEMYGAIMREATTCDIFFAVAAVSDYHCQTIATQKIHKDKDTLTLTFERNKDIVASVSALSNKPYIVGFAAETENVLQNARIKRERKKMDIIIANQVAPGVGMGSDDNEAVLIGSDRSLTFSKQSKRQLARALIAIIAETFQKRAR